MPSLFCVTLTSESIEADRELPKGAEEDFIVQCRLCLKKSAEIACVVYAEQRRKTSVLKLNVGEKIK
jgi:hypothetical protein